MENNQEVDNGGMKTLEGYFDKPAVAAVNEQCLLEQLMANNTKLAANNESLLVMVKKLNGDIKKLERDNSRLNKGGQVSGRGPTLCHHCKKEGSHHPDACY